MGDGGGAGARLAATAASGTAARMRILPCRAPDRIDPCPRTSFPIDRSCTVGCEVSPKPASHWRFDLTMKHRLTLGASLAIALLACSAFAEDKPTSGLQVGDSPRAFN